jgi:hypothetical protein
MRGMAIRPVNPQKATSMVGYGPDQDDEFVVTHLARDARTRKVDRKQEDYGTGREHSDEKLNHRGDPRSPDRQDDDRRSSQTHNK